jgi:hypothetical protein
VAKKRAAAATTATATTIQCCWIVGLLVDLDSLFDRILQYLTIMSHIPEGASVSSSTINFVRVVEIFLPQ